MSQHGWPDCPGEVRAQVNQLVIALRRTLPDLIGLYLHGSLAMGCFNPARSDIDLLALTHHRMTTDSKRVAAELLLRHSNAPCPIEISFLNPGDLRPWRHPAPFDFHFSEDWREKISNDLAGGEWAKWNDEPHTDPDLAAHITVTFARGLHLHGPPPPDAFPSVPAEHYLASLMGDFEWALDRLAGDPAYFVLNACRLIAYVKDRCVLSKDEGGVWGLSHLPVEWSGLIQAALAAYRGEEECLPVDRDAIEQFAAAIGDRIRK